MSSICPGCERDAGTNTIFLHCGTDLQRRIHARTFGLISIEVAVVGSGVGPDIARFLGLA